jgi:homoserine kinase
MKNIKLQVPGTVANLVCGFDILGMALNEPFDEMEFKLLDERKIIIHHEDEFICQPNQKKCSRSGFAQNFRKIRKSKHRF